MESEVNQKIRKLYQWKFYKAEEESTIYKWHKSVSQKHKSPHNQGHILCQNLLVTPTQPGGKNILVCIYKWLSII